MTASARRKCGTSIYRELTAKCRSEWAAQQSSREESECGRNVNCESEAWMGSRCHYLPFLEGQILNIACSGDQVSP